MRPRMRSCKYLTFQAAQLTMILCTRPLMSEAGSFPRLCVVCYHKQILFFSLFLEAKIREEYAVPDNVHTKYLLNEDEMPRSWYNIAADLPRAPEPVLHPGTKQPVTPDDLSPLFPMALIMQEVSTERYIEIPEPVRQVYLQWRPSPLFRARRLEKALDTPARIYYKYEGVSPGR